MFNRGFRMAPDESADRDNQQSPFHLKRLPARFMTSLPQPKSNPGRGGRKKNTRPHGQRGELAARILEALESAGKQGAKVRDLASSLGVNPKNLFIWFATTGKKNK